MTPGILANLVRWTGGADDRRSLRGRVRRGERGVACDQRREHAGAAGIVQGSNGPDFHGRTGACFSLTRCAATSEPLGKILNYEHSYSSGTYGETDLTFQQGRTRLR